MKKRITLALLIACLAQTANMQSPKQINHEEHERAVKFSLLWAFCWTMKVKSFIPESLQKITRLYPRTAPAVTKAKTLMPSFFKTQKSRLIRTCQFAFWWPLNIYFGLKTLQAIRQAHPAANFIHSGSHFVSTIRKDIVEESKEINKIITQLFSYTKQ